MDGMDPETFNEFLKYLALNIQTQDRNIADTNNPQVYNPNPVNVDLDSVLNKRDNLLKQWCGLNFSNITYDSKGKQFAKPEFFEACLQVPNCYFIFQDNLGNVFGCFMKKGADKLVTGFNFVPNYDPDHFIFSLESNGRLEQPTKWIIKEGKEAGIFLFAQNESLIDIGNHEGHVVISVPNFGECYCRNLQNVYEGMNDTDINGSIGIYQNFSIERVVVIQME